MGARGCLGPLLLLLLLPPLPWSGASGVGSESLPGAVAAAGGDRTWLQPSIIGGHEAKRHSRPYMAFLQIRGGRACGAALLQRRWALTAAHCLNDSSWDEERLLVGLHNRRDDEKDTKSFTIRAVCRHPGYDSDTMENDLLLLQELEVTVMDTRMCNNSRFWHGGIGPTMICFQGLRRGSTPANGDSGGPLVCGKRPAVAGVVSFSGQNPSDPFEPPVATSTVKHRKWIQKILRKGCGSSQPEHTG
ncbi:granzyme M-like isoform 2-T3 [Geothlypis trichas]